MIVLAIVKNGEDSESTATLERISSLEKYRDACIARDQPRIGVVGMAKFPVATRAGG